MMDKDESKKATEPIGYVNSLKTSSSSTLSSSFRHSSSLPSKSSTSCEPSIVNVADAAGVDIDTEDEPKVQDISESEIHADNYNPYPRIKEGTVDG
jgi:hypothetical protein